MKVPTNLFLRGWGTVLIIELAACGGFYLPWEEVFHGIPAAFTGTNWVIRITGFVFLSMAFTYVYSMVNKTDSWVNDGLRFGAVTGLFVASGYFIGYSFGKMSTNVLTIHLIGSIVKFTIAGIGVAWAMKSLNRPRQETAAM